MKIKPIQRVFLKCDRKPRKFIKVEQKDVQEGKRDISYAPPTNNIDIMV